MIRRSLHAALLLAAVWVLLNVARYYAGGPRHRAESAWFVLTALILAALAYDARRARVAIAQPPVAPGQFAALGIAVAGSVALYWPALGIGLLSDDYVLLARSTASALDPYAWEHFRPLPMLVWKALDPFGDPAAFHALNIVLHGLNAWLLGRLSLRLGHRAAVAVLVGALVLFFPAAVEPVTWISGLFDVSTVFFGLLFVHGAIAPSKTAQYLGLAALIAALASKETAVALPAIAAAVALRTRFNRLTLGVSFVLAGSYAVARILARTADDAALLATSRSMRYAIKEFFVRPFAALGAPWTAAELQPAVSMLVLGLIPLAILLALMLAHAVRGADGRRPFTGLAWVVLGIVPLAPIFFVGANLESSRYLYLPLCGWSLFIGDLIDTIDTHQARIAVTAGLLVAVIGAGAWGVRRHLRPWQEAALLRDRILAEARVALLTTRCQSATFENVPAVHDGAQLFRNGLSEAVRDMEYRWEGAPCRFEWTGRQFVPRH